MSLEADRSGECLLFASEEVQSRKRNSRPASITNAYSAKRRRVSLASIDLLRELQARPGSISELGPETAADRFIPSRPKHNVPLNITPRSNRLARIFNLADDRLMSYADGPYASAESGMSSLLKKSVSSLFQTQPTPRPTSAASNLAQRKQCLLALDAPGISPDQFSFPISWSLDNFIAVACRNEVYYQNLDTREVIRLGGVSRSRYGDIWSVEWGGERRKCELATGTTHGVVQIWDARREVINSVTTVLDNDPAGGMSWAGDVLAVGRESGAITFFDIRAARNILTLSNHKEKVHGVKWSMDENYLASGDDAGTVLVYDFKAGKNSGNSLHNGKMRHRGPVKALAWCPWKPELLATASTFPEGKIHIWNTSTLSTSIPSPLHTIPLNTSIFSLHWSPHCKELLSTHGSSFVPPLAPSRRRSFPHLHPTLSSPGPTPRPPRKFIPVSSPLSNSVTVHAYPSCVRIVSVVAHSGPVGHSVLNPDGSKLFTSSPHEQAMKMWQIWAKREDVEKRDSVFDKCAIR